MRALVGLLAFVLCSAAQFALLPERCKPGHAIVVDSTGRHVGCELCPAGKYAASSGVAWHRLCFGCEPGRYQPKAGTSSCEACPMGQYGPLSGAVKRHAQCRACPSGQHAPAAGAGFCMAATPPPSPIPLRNNAKPNVCPRGMFGTAKFTRTGERVADCHPCPPGRYSANFGATQCTLCESGRAQSRSGQYACERCPSGRMQQQIGEASCTACPPGRFETLQRDECAAMPTCAPGSFLDVSRLYAKKSNTCVLCLQGQHQSSWGAMRCNDCPGMWFQDQRGQTVCKRCPTGKFQALSGQPKCVWKPGFAPVPTTRAPTAAPTPHATPAPTPAPTPFTCPAGRYLQQLYGQKMCFGCPAGKFSSSRGETSCESCAPGRFQANSVAQTCDKCPLGKFQLAHGREFCQAGVAPQPPASVNEAPTKTSETPTSTFASNSGRTTSTTTTTTTIVKTISAVSSAATTTRNSPSTTKTPKTSTTTSALAKPKTPSTTPLTKQNRCSAGRFWASGACYACPRGKFAELSRRKACKECPAGKYQPADGKEVCIVCASGKIQPSAGERSCISVPSPLHGGCGPGEFHDRILGRCIACFPGRYNPHHSQQRCPLCPAGKFSSQPGRLSCSTCVTGKAQPKTGGHNCLDCDEGWHSIAGQACRPVTRVPTSSLSTTTVTISSAAAVNHTNLPIQAQAYIKSTTAAATTTTTTTTTTVPLPTFPVLTTHAPAPSNCPAGRYRTNLYGMQFCFACPPGKFRTANAHGDCKTCSAGRYQPIQGQAKCITLDEIALDVARSHPGWTRARVLIESRKVAGIAHAPSGTSAITAPTPVMTQYPALQTTQSATLSPTYTTTRALTHAPSPAPTHVLLKNPFHAKLNGVNCPAGRYDWKFQHKTYCMSCPPGKFQPYTSATYCYECPVGRFQTNADKTECKSCPIGRSNTVGQRATCSVAAQAPSISCDPGHFGILMGTTPMCRICPGGKFNPTPETSKCTFCPKGQYSDASRTKCVHECPRGNFLVPLGPSSSVACDKCPNGKFQPQAGQPVCLICATGQFQPHSGQTRCLDNSASASPQPCNCDPMQHASRVTRCSHQQHGTPHHLQRIRVVHISEAHHRMSVSGDEQHRCKWADGKCRCCECKRTGGPLETFPREHDWAAPPFLNGGPIIVRSREQCEFSCVRHAACKAAHFGASGRCWMSSQLALSPSKVCKAGEAACASFVRVEPSAAP